LLQVEECVQAVARTHCMVQHRSSPGDDPSSFVRRSHFFKLGRDFN
jgi:hypothetical protein